MVRAKQTTILLVNTQKKVWIRWVHEFSLIRAPAESLVRSTSLKNRFTKSKLDLFTTTLIIGCGWSKLRHHFKEAKKLTSRNGFKRWWTKMVLITIWAFAEMTVKRIEKWKTRWFKKPKPTRFDLREWLIKTIAVFKELLKRKKSIELRWTTFT